MTHYHIRWAQIPLLDWESFNTRVEAEAAAQILARPGETYTIEEYDETCPRCRAAMTRLPSSEGAAAARGPLGRFDTDVSFDAKVTGGITIQGRGEEVSNSHFI